MDDIDDCELADYNSPQMRRIKFSTNTNSLKTLSALLCVLIAYQAARY